MKKLSSRLAILTLILSIFTFSSPVFAAIEPLDPDVTAVENPAAAPPAAENPDPSLSSSTPTDVGDRGSTTNNPIETENSDPSAENSPPSSGTSPPIYEIPDTRYDSENPAEVEFSDSTVNSAEAPAPPIIFWGRGCPHCGIVNDFIKKHNLDNLLSLDHKEIYTNPENAQEFNRICEEHSIGLLDRGVPMMYTEGQCIIGDQPIIKYLDQKLAGLESDSQNQNSEPSKLTLPIVIAAALVDAINPCAFAVLIILMTAILAAGNRKRALYAGLAFAASIYISYLLMGIGLYHAISSAGISSLFMKIIGGLALLLGLLNVKDYFWYGKGILMEVPRAWRPKMKSLIRSITSPFGAFVIGFLISLFLLPCTSGPYIVILGMLAEKSTQGQAFWLLVFYNAIFVLPMLIITAAVYLGFSPEKAEALRQQKLRVLHLIAGLILIAMGIVILLGWV